MLYGDNRVCWYRGLLKIYTDIPTLKVNIYFIISILKLYANTKEFKPLVFAPSSNYKREM